MRQPEPEPIDAEDAAFFADLNLPVDPDPAAAFLNVKTKTLANWRWAGTGPEYLKHGEGHAARISYLPRVLIRYRNAMRRHSTSDASP